MANNNDSEQAEKSKFKYVGMHYNKSLKVKGAGSIDPKKMNKTQAKALVKDYPKLARLWTGL